MRFCYILIIALTLFGCSQSSITISDQSNTHVGNFASNELSNYLNKLYGNADFSLAEKDGNADFQLMLTNQVLARGIEISDLPQQLESYKIANHNHQLFIIAPDERGLLNATYALLESQGYGFYLSGDIIPEQKEWTGFESWELQDEPTTGDRILFNWHNFLSGCTGWNLPDWQIWIDQANKMRFNSIMVHAYGNNPMFSFEYLGEKKTTGLLNNSSAGRDWGNQHVNDVRRVAGGEIFDASVYGATASIVTIDKKEKEATQLMQNVFKYAEDRGTKVIFALDFDTWMANPRNIIEKLPKEAVFELDNGHLTPNPAHPEGYAYYKHVLHSLLKMYPEIDQLSVWHRRPSLKPGLGTIWMNFPYEKLPELWLKEYRDIISANPQIKDDLLATSMFAYSKLIQALQKARDELKPELKISTGSWRFNFVKYADVFLPKEVALIPLDWSIVFDQEEEVEDLKTVGANREVFPIIWAHHDDHRYIGRPYTPWENLSSKLQDTNSTGFGIIHWTTRPLDLYFSSSARQVWLSTENEAIKRTVDKYVADLFSSPDEELSNYYFSWLSEGPMFGRETSDHFIDIGKQKLGHGLESWETMLQKTSERLKLISAHPGIKESEELMYQKEMEDFYQSFFENQMIFQKAYELTELDKIVEAIEVLNKAEPETVINKYVKAIQHVGFTSGEKAMVFSMNIRWLTDFKNLEQRLGFSPVKYRFSPTQHDSLAQAPGHYSYFIDNSREWWRCMWMNEMKNETFTQKNDESWLEINNRFEFPLRSMHGQQLPDGIYHVKLMLSPGQIYENIIIKQKEKALTYEANTNEISFDIDLGLSDKFEISTGTSLKLQGIVVSKRRN